MRMRKKKNLVPRMERCGDRLIRDPYDHIGHWKDLVPEAREIHLELGCGKGRFTAGTAAADPDVLLIAVEIVPDAMVVAMERCVNAGLKNVFFIDERIIHRISANLACSDNKRKNENHNCKNKNKKLHLFDHRLDSRISIFLFFVMLLHFLFSFPRKFILQGYP